MTCGIYKITSPIGEIYIGQSCNIENRFKQYYTQRCTEQPKLFKSLCKYGYINHIFEVIEECDKSLLNKQESHYQKFYNVLEKGLNCRIESDGKCKRIVDNETKYKMGSSFRNKHTKNSIKVKCLFTGKIYPSVKNCAKVNNINYSTLKQKLNGYNRIKSEQFIYLKDEVI